MPGSYIDRIAAEIRHAAGHEASILDDDLRLYRLYAVLLLARGAGVNAADVHNAWAAWASECDPENRNLVPFKELSQRMQKKDERYVSAIRTAADRILTPPDGGIES
jgi:hypothetical protein